MKIVFNVLKDKPLTTTRQGNEKAFLNLFELFKNKVYSYCRHITHSETTAEDITQEVFMKVWLQMPSLADVNNIEAWILTITRNYCFNYLKRKATEQKFVKVACTTNPGCNNSVDYINYKDQMNHLTRVVNSLPYRQRVIFNLNRNEGLKNDEIARQLNISTHTVKSHFVKALRKVRDEMQTHSAIFIAAGILSKYFF